jgi:hypothetical protein
MKSSDTFEGMFYFPYYFIRQISDAYGMRCRVTKNDFFAIGHDETLHLR